MADPALDAMKETAVVALGQRDDAQARLAEALQALREADDLLQRRAYLLAHGTVQRALVRLEEAE